MASEEDEEPLSSRLHIVQSQKREIAEKGKKLENWEIYGENCDPGSLWKNMIESSRTA